MFVWGSGHRGRAAQHRKSRASLLMERYGTEGLLAVKQGPFSTIPLLLGLGPPQRAPAPWLSWTLAQREAGGKCQGGRESSPVRSYPAGSLPWSSLSLAVSLCQMVAASIKSPSSSFRFSHPCRPGQPLFLALAPTSEFLCTSPTLQRSLY